MLQSDMYLENFTQIKISEETNVSKDYRPNKPIEIIMYLLEHISSSGSRIEYVISNNNK